MAFIIKSDAVLRDAAQAVGNIHGYYGPQDYRAMLDFTHQIYKVDGEKKSFSDVVSFSRTGGGQSYDTLDRLRDAGTGQPRFHKYGGDVNESGLLVEGGVKNFLASDDNDATFIATSSGDNLNLSWEGSGSVSIVLAGTALVSEVVASGRTTRFYSRGGGTLTGTIAVTGAAKNIMVSNGNYVQTYLPHKAERTDDQVLLAGMPLAILAGGTGTIICRYALAPDNGVALRGASMSLSNASAPNGGIRVGVPLSRNALNTGFVNLHSDGAATNASTQVARNLGNRSDKIIFGTYFENFGERAGIICFGQAGSGTAAEASVTPPTAIDEVWLSRVRPGMISGGVPAGGVLTHCIIYDRMVTDDEAFDMAVFGG